MITEDEYTQLTSIDRPHIQVIFSEYEKRDQRTIYYWDLSGLFE